MYAKIFNFKFNGVAEAKVAASFISDAFGKLIVANNMRSLNISIGKCGSLSIQTKFETGDDLKLFEIKVNHMFLGIYDFSLPVLKFVLTHTPSLVAVN